jgi:hypothetical protein
LRCNIQWLNTFILNKTVLVKTIVWLILYNSISPHTRYLAHLFFAPGSNSNQWIGWMFFQLFINSCLCVL